MKNETTLATTTTATTATILEPYFVDYGGTAGIHYGDGVRFTSGQTTTARLEYPSSMEGYRCIPLVSATEADLLLLDNWNIDRVRAGIAILLTGQRWD